ncbi:MAG: hypothetical protein HYY95_05395, partial [Candidatus Rokubacteria bacterium]|nr:hypothetical protein [Candidatus Rokubacteria bacterium]
VFGGLDVLVASAAASAFKPVVELGAHNSSPESSWIVGQCIAVDGGFSLT